MKLIEEYLQRHQLNVPMIYRQDRLSMFTRQKGDFPYHIHSLSLHVKKNGPNFYYHRVSRPLHNGYRGNLVEDIKVDEIPWEDYEKTVLAFSNYKSTAVSEAIEIGLAAWEIFVYTHDGLLTSFANNDTFFATLDPKLSAAERYENYKVAFSHFEGIKQTEPFRRELSKWLKNYHVIPSQAKDKK